jgi:hypothetical protein
MRTPKRGALIYEITGRKPGGRLKPLEIKTLIWEAMQELKRAEVTKVVDIVRAKPGFRTRQTRQDQQIKWYLWKLAQEGVLRLREDRRYKVRLG